MTEAGRPGPAMRDHLANERTLLAWIRTAVTVIGLGFLLDRLTVETNGDTLATVAGVMLVVFGGVLALAGGYSYESTRRTLGPGPYRSNAALHLTLVAVVALGALVIAAYLLIT